MAWFAVTSLMRTIELEFLQPYPRLVLHHKEAEALEALHRKLAQLLAFLDESENQLNDDDETTKEWKARIKEVALRIEDQIESAIIDICGREDPRWRFLGRVYDYIQPKRFLTTLQNALESTDYLQPKRFLTTRDGANVGTMNFMDRKFISFHNTVEFTGEFMELVKNKQPMKDLQIKDDDDDIPSSSQKIGHRHHSAAGSKLRSTTMVGRHNEVNLIKELLLQDSPKERRVVPIVGMGGIGKTKLAQTLYEDPSVSSHFDVVAWTTVSAQSDMRQMLLQPLSTMQISQENEIINTRNEELADLLRKCLMGRRYLIVVDDLWSTASWDEIQRCFPENSNGSRILVTTRLQEVAISTGSHNYMLNLPFLNPDESWELFSGRILNYGSLSLPPMKLEGIWRHIVEYCKGLPFAIVIVSGLVQATNESLWESHSEEIEKILCATVTNSLLDNFSEILRLSYNHLPNVLRVCFLYLGVFCEDSAISTKKLIRLWIAEGFVKVEEDERSLEEVAEDYLDDLVSRSLVLVDSLSLDGKIKSCKVHDIVHDFCRNEAMKEGLLHVASRYSSVRTTERWLSFESMYPKLDVQTGFNRYGSLFCFHDDGHMTPQVYQLPATPHFKRLRVLDLGSLHFITGIPSYVADLILLRYLALRPSKSLSSLPVLKDWNLQTLVLLENWGVSTSAEDPKPLIPEIWELPKLRHLQFCRTIVLGTPTVVHQCIQTVQWLRPFQCTEQVFLSIPNAKVMGIFMEGSVEFGEPNCLDNLRCLNQLEELKIESRHNPVLLPVVDAFPVQLKKLKLKGTLVPWDAMRVIGMLPNLQVLKLKNGACQGGYWKLTEGSFCQLKSLLIYGSGLRHWEATGDNYFPVLERLILKECYELEEIPSSFGEILTLKLIELFHCYSGLVNSAKQIQEEQRDYGNDELVVRAYNIWRNAEDELEDEVADELEDEVAEELEGSKDSEGDFEE